MNGLLITFEGTEGSGKTTQIQLLADWLGAAGRTVRLLREPGGTPVGEEIRHTLKHSPHNAAMTPETELLLLNASRAQLVREVIRPALAAGEVILCDRFYDSTVVYQGCGRGLDPAFIRTLIRFAVGATEPDLTLLLMVPLALSESRRGTRERQVGRVRDRIEEAGREFFLRVERGYQALARDEPGRVKLIDGTRPAAEVHHAVVEQVERFTQTR